METIWVAVIGVVGILITSGTAIWVAIINNRKERGGAADSGVEAGLRLDLATAESKLVQNAAIEKTLRERIVLGEERLAACNEDRVQLQGELDDKDATIASQGLLIAEQIEKIARYAEGEKPR